MQAAAITEGNVSIRRGSVTKRETVIYLGINVKNNVKAQTEIVSFKEVIEGANHKYLHM